MASRPAAQRGDQRLACVARRLVISSDFHKAYQSLACIDGVDPLWCWAHYPERAVMPMGKRFSLAAAVPGLAVSA